MPEIHEQTVTDAALIQPQKTGELHSYKLGSNNPNSRTVTIHPLDALLELKLNDFDLADSLIAAAKKGESWAIALIYARVAGLPVQRQEAKLLAIVQDDARRISKEQGIPYEDIIADVKRLAQGT
jgi:hypothetical protein